MGYIHCCGGLRKTRIFEIAPEKKFIMCKLDVLKKCPVCNHLVIQLTRVDDENHISFVRYINKKAQMFLNKIQKKILYEIRDIDYTQNIGGSFYLDYNEFGIKKRCYSNFTNLKIGIQNLF